MEPTTLLLILSGMFVGWTIGANDAANCMGASVGCGVLSSRNALILVSLFAYLGAILEGKNTMHTVGNTIIDIASIDPVFIAIALIAAALLITSLTLFSIPISSTQAVLGALIGLGISSSVSVNWKQLFTIFGLGLLTPIAAALASFLFYKYVLQFVLNKYSFVGQEKFISFLVLSSGLFLAYSL